MSLIYASNKLCPKAVLSKTKQNYHSSKLVQESHHRAFLLLAKCARLGLFAPTLVLLVWGEVIRETKEYTQESCIDLDLKTAQLLSESCFLTT